MDNPAYDPNMYSSFVPQDSVQQYANSYGGGAGGAGLGGVGGGAGGAGLGGVGGAGFGGVGGGGGAGFGGVGGGGGGGFGGVGGGYGGPGFGGAIGTPYAGGYGGIDPSGFAVQSGYEGYLVPSFPPGGYNNYLRPFNGIFKSLLPHPKAFIGFIAKAGVLLFSAIGTVLIGGLVTTLLCTFTSVCNISFANLPFLQLKETAKEISTTLGQEITPDRVKRAAAFVKNAIEKYSQLQELAH